MTPKLGAVDANLAQAEQLARQAASKGAALIVLPEMFTSAAAFHESMMTAIRPLDGTPARLLKDLARQENAIIGGSFLAEDAGRVYNAFLLAMPDGTTLRHDKDLPTYWETCYYEKGNDAGVLTTPLGPMGRRCAGRWFVPTRRNGSLARSACCSRARPGGPCPRKRVPIIRFGRSIWRC
jgi:predicted amidohydrolase